VSLADLFAAAGVTLASDNVLSDIWEVPLAQVAPIVPYLLLVLILIFRPTGLLGTRET
jgi:branched-chain amino acid transport system permease protein